MNSVAIRAIGSRLALFLVGLVLSLPSESYAGDGKVQAELEFHAPKDCPGESDFRNLVIGRVGYNPFSPSSDATMAVTVERDADGLYSGTIEYLVADKLSKRSLEPSVTCTDTTELLAMITAGMFTTLPSPNRAAKPEKAPPTREKRSSLTIEVQAQKSDDGLELGFYAAAAMNFEVGSAPTPMLGYDLSLGIRLGDSFHVSAFTRGGFTLTSATVEITDAPQSSQTDWRAFKGGIRACAGWWQLDFCGGAWGGILDVEISPGFAPGNASATIAAGELLLAFHQPITSNLNFHAGVLSAVYFVRPSLEIGTPTRKIWRAAPATFGANIGLELRL